MDMFRNRFWWIFAILAAAIPGCGGEEGASAGGRILVVAAFYPLEEVARRVGGDRVDVSNLTPPGSEPHDLELRSSDVLALRRAKLVLYVGDGFQPAVERAVRDLPRGQAVDVLTDVSRRSSLPELLDDPHVWLSPPLVKEIVTAVEAALAEHLPEDRSEIASRAAAFGADLDALDEEFRRGLGDCARREIYTSHAAFGHLAARYRLTQVAITGVDPEAEPSPRRLQDVAAQARQGGATTIFFETLVSPRVSQAVARIVGARTGVLDPIEGLSDQDRAAGKDYFSVMRQNLRALREALGCKA